MDRKDPISDETINKNVGRQLAACGLRSPCHIQAQTRRGEVTLSGTVQFVHQRNAAVQAIRAVEGVRRIVEKIKVKAAPRPQYKELPAWKPAGQPEAEKAETEAAAVDGQAAMPAAPPETDPPLPNPNDSPPAEAAAVIDDESSDFSVGPAEATDSQSAAKPIAIGMRHTRLGDSYTFECASQEEAERLRQVLSAYSDWFAKNSWIGKPKQKDDSYRVTFHVKSVIDFLRQAGF